MIYLLSDPHGDINHKGLKQYLSEAGKDDLLILLGDICMKFEDTEENRIFTEWFLSSDKKIAFIDGNHENFDFLESFPEEEWNGGVVGRITENIVHLKRGNVYSICDKTFFVFGGCKSSAKWKELGLWYPGEEPTEEELELAYGNIRKNGFKFDYILTHKYEEYPPYGTVSMPLMELVKYMEENVEYGKWYSGHGHRNEKIDEKHFMVYDEPVLIS